MQIKISTFFHRFRCFELNQTVFFFIRFQFEFKQLFYLFFRSFFLSRSSGVKLKFVKWFTSNGNDAFFLILFMFFFTNGFLAANDISLSNYKTEWSDEPYVSTNEFQ